MIPFYQIQDAPEVCFELLPNASKAFMIEVLPYTKKYGNKQPISAINITTWAPGVEIETSGGDMEAAFEDFYDRTCTDCRYHTSEYEIDMDGEYVTDSEGLECLAFGYVSARSPCPCYDDGISSVSWPCPDGHDEPDASPPDVDAISARAMAYTNIIDPSNYECLDNLAFQQLADVRNNGVYVSSRERAINTFTGTDSICWGQVNKPVDSLYQIEQEFVTSKCNEDLMDFDSHHEYCVDIRDEDPDEYDFVPEGEILMDVPRKAVVIADLQFSANTYLLLATSGCKIKENFAYIPVYEHKDVRLDKDTVADVWASEPTSIGKRLLFVYFDGDETSAQYIGQVDSTFDLTPCKSNQPLLSALGALVSN